MTLRRGFKSEANRDALEVRAELGLRPHSPLCPWALAEHLLIPVSTLDELGKQNPEIAAEVKLFTGLQRSVFSATSIFDRTKRWIVHNGSHARVRQRSNIAHELAHARLQHPPHALLCSSGERTYESALEEEAAWLGSVLLVSDEAARWAMARGMSVARAAAQFEVSEELMEFRFRMSGARQIRRRTSQPAM
jgi:Zn-dependent peptidase ImmA (M78 family)